jgi:hypothetical protein
MLIAKSVESLQTPQDVDVKAVVILELKAWHESLCQVQSEGRAWHSSRRQYILVVFSRNFRIISHLFIFYTGMKSFSRKCFAVPVVCIRPMALAE